MSSAEPTCAIVEEREPDNLDQVSPVAPANLSLTNRTASGVTWMMLVQVARQLLQLVSVSVLARHIPPSAYGLVAMAALVTNFMETVRDGGIGYALVREREVSRELVSTVFWLNCLIGGGATLLVIAASWPAAHFFHEKLVATILQFLAVSFFLGALSVVPTALLNRAMEFRKLAVAQTSGVVMGTTVAIAMALNGRGVWSLVAASIATAATTAALVWSFAPVRVSFVLRRAETRHFLHFGMNLTGFHVVNYVSRNADNLLVGRFLGSAPLGYYQMGYMLLTYPISNFAAVVTQVVYPAVATIRDDLERCRAAYTRACSLVALVTFPLMLGLAVTAGPFVRVLLGDRWMPVAALLIVFGPLGAAQSIYTTTGLIYNTTGRTDIQFRWSILASAIYVLSFVLGSRWGILGVASCYAVAWTVLMVPSFLIPFRLIGLSGAKFLQALWPTISYSLAMMIAAAAWRVALWRVGVKNAAIELVTTVLVGASLYVALLFWRRPPVLSELKNVVQGSDHPLLRILSRLVARP
jgi:PST family polysaccharide transporter